MFDDSPTKLVEIKSNHLRKLVSQKDSSSQTENILFANIGVQSHKTKEFQTQSDPPPAYPTAPETNQKKLNDFATRAEGALMEILKLSSQSNAFSDYASRGSESTNLITEYEKIENNLNSSISYLDWNPSGILLAATFCQSFHTGFCTHETQILIWNIARDNIKQKTHEHSLKLDSCGTVVKFHPHDGTILAVGGYSGQVMIFSLMEGIGPVSSNFSSSLDGHFRYIIDISWQSEGNKNKLLSYSADSIIILWNISSDHKMSRLRCLDFSAKFGEDLLRVLSIGKDDLLCGTTTGGTFKISWDSKNPLKRNKNLNNIGIVGLATLKGSSNVLSVSKWGVLEVTASDETRPVGEVGEVVTGFDCIGDVVVVGLAEGAFCFFRFKGGCVELCERFVHGNSISCVKLSPHLDILATGDTLGVIKLWKLR